ncbi:hypothetical protein AMECASPLE_011059 [Ameca splendens]|uniref:Uncharacterized protein n=1 Tax=Ameca splendens TaxID=208324 RepID=A0ABV0XDR5_9TELE
MMLCRSWYDIFKTPSDEDRQRHAEKKTAMITEREEQTQILMKLIGLPTLLQECTNSQSLTQPPTHPQTHAHSVLLKLYSQGQMKKSNRAETGSRSNHHLSAKFIISFINNRTVRQERFFGCFVERLQYVQYKLYLVHSFSHARTHRQIKSSLSCLM